MNNAVFGKTMENMSKHRDIKVVTTETSRNCLLSEPNYHTTNFFQKIYQPLCINQLEIVLYRFWSDYANQNMKKCYMDTDNFIVYIKTEDIYSDITKDVETRSDTSNYELDHCLK